jgi:hypothetical protein
MVVALAALFIALGGPAQAGKLIDGKSIRKSSVTSKQVKDGTLKPRDLSRKARRVLTATANGSVTEPKLATNAVSTRALAPGSVLTGIVADDTLTAADLAANSVGADELADNAVGQAEIRNNGVGASEIADNTIDGGEIIDGGLSVRDIARQVATFEWTLPEIAVDKCEGATVTLQGIDLTGAYVLATPMSAWPNALVYTVNGTNTDDEFRVVACNRGTAPVAGATYTFGYAVLGN